MAVRSSRWMENRVGHTEKRRWAHSGWPTWNSGGQHGLWWNSCVCLCLSWELGYAMRNGGGTWDRVGGTQGVGRSTGWQPTWSSGGLHSLWSLLLFYCLYLYPTKSKTLPAGWLWFSSGRFISPPCLHTSSLVFFFCTEL